MTLPDPLRLPRVSVAFSGVSVSLSARGANGSVTGSCSHAIAPTTAAITRKRVRILFADG